MKSIFLLDKTLLSRSRCDRPKGELLYNWTFDCGLDGWHFDDGFPAVITDNGDGSIHLEAIDRYGSVVPNKQDFPINTYVLEIEVANVSGNGKMSIRNKNNQWFNLLTFNTDGLYSVEYTGNISEIHCGADNDMNFECDFLSYSLKEKTLNVVYNGEPVTYNTEEVIYND